MNTTTYPERQSPTLRTRDVADLAVASGFPCISVLMPTEPGPRLAAADLRRLGRLVARVDDRLREHGVLKRSRLMHLLSDEVRRAATEPTGRGLAIYVSQVVRRRFQLPQPVQARAVVESTFATRPLIAALHRTPPHAVLVVHPTCAHLYAVSDGQLRPVGQLDAFDPGSAPKGIEQGGPAPAVSPERAVDTHLRAVDRMLRSYRSEHPSPLVLAGTPGALDRFCAMSGNLERLAGRLDFHGSGWPLDLASASADAITRYLRDRREGALRRLEETLRSRPEAVAAGIDQCWYAARFRKPDLLFVEEGFVSPGVPITPLDGGDRDGPAKPGSSEIHDAVDDLIEQVILRGGELALVHDGQLDGHGRVALISRD